MLLTYLFVCFSSPLALYYFICTVFVTYVLGFIVIVVMYLLHFLSFGINKKKKKQKKGFVLYLTGFQNKSLV